MARSQAISLALLALSFASAAVARETSTSSSTAARSTPKAGTPQGTAPGPTRDKVTRSRDAESKEHGSMLVLEGAANIPLDVGVEAGFEAPFGLRVFGGYGWVVAPYAGLLRGTSLSESGARVVIDEAETSGHVFRAKVGVRPFRELGLYFDAGFGRAELDGIVNVTGSVTNVGSLSGGYTVHSTLDLWLVELGYQTMIANRLVLAFGFGFTGMLGASTTITPLGVASYTPSASVAEAETSVDHAIEKYGFVPTLNLHLGFNVL